MNYRPKKKSQCAYVSNVSCLIYATSVIGEILDVDADEVWTYQPLCLTQSFSVSDTVLIDQSDFKKFIALIRSQH